MKKAAISFVIFLLLSGILKLLSAQIIDNYKSFTISSFADTIKYDSLITIPSSLLLKDVNNCDIDTSLYFIDNINSIIILFKGLPDKLFPISIRYKVFPFKLEHSYYNRKMLINKNVSDSLIINPQSDFTTIDVLPNNYGNISKNGSIVRGISLGTNKNASLQSAFDLQLQGQLNEEFNIRASVTDRNVPYQPDGNTQQLQEFDKVFINLYNSNTSIIAGDYDLSASSGYFFKLNKKNQGLWLQHHHLIRHKNANSNSSASHILSGAITKGKFIQKAIEIRDGVQGPYKLSGTNNELYIIIIAGSEKIYMNGVLLTRGADNDYIIDYNTAEITFTARHAMTKDLRMIAEYEYSDKNYARTAFYGSNELNIRKFQFKISYYSEQDLKNQPLSGTITEQQKDFMRNDAANSTILAFPGIDSTEFSTDMIMYKMSSKAIAGIIYDSVFEYSVNIDSAHYKLSFSYLGKGNGNYVQIRNQANGRIFEWVAPVNNIKQGDYEPIVFLYTPQQQQLINLQTNYQITKNLKFINELAVSNKDINTFSNINTRANQGYAVKNQFLHVIPISDSLNKLWKLDISATQLFIERNFKTPEPFRSVEYNREWGFVNPAVANQNDYELAVNISNINNYKIGIFGNYTQFESIYNGLKSGYLLQLYPYKTCVEGSGHVLSAQDSAHKIEILYNTLHIKQNFKWVTLGALNLFERNETKHENFNNYSIGSYENNDYRFYINNADTAKHYFSLQYNNKTNRIPQNYQFRRDIINNIASLNYKISKLEWTYLNFLISYRESKLYDTTNTMINSDYGLLSNVEHRIKFDKIPVSFYTTIENSSMMEVRYDYSFIEVGTGMGHYIWNDYNGNQIKELYEFELSPIPTEANYIKILLPTNGYVKVYQTQFSETINAGFPKHWRNLMDMRGFFYRFSNQLNFQYHKKTDSRNWNDAYNPFNFQLPDSLLKAGRKFIRNTVFFNRTSQVYAAEFTYENQKNKMLLIDGSEELVQELYGLKNRLGINRSLQLENNINQRRKEKRSTLFQLKNYSLLAYEMGLKLNCQPNNVLRIAPFSQLNFKQGKAQQLNVNTSSSSYGVEVKWSQRFQSSIIGKMSYINVKTNSVLNNPLLFDMIEIFKPGDNYMWNIIYQKSINQNLQINVTYDGRAAPNATTIHVGNVQLRAYF